MVGPSKVNSCRSRPMTKSPSRLVDHSVEDVVEDVGVEHGGGKDVADVVEASMPTPRRDKLTISGREFWTTPCRTGRPDRCRLACCCDGGDTRGGRAGIVAITVILIVIPVRSALQSRSGSSGCAGVLAAGRGQSLNLG
jgi:hypothetical protein